MGVRLRSCGQSRGVSVNSSSGTTSEAVRLGGELRREWESEGIEHHHYGELSSDEHPGEVVDERLDELKLFKPFKQPEQHAGVELQQPHLKPCPIKLQPSGLPKLLLLLMHCSIQPLLQPLLQLLQDDRALGIDEEEENVLLEQCVELNGKAEVTSKYSKTLSRTAVDILVFVTFL